MTKVAALYRMVTNDHVCPYGIRSKYLLKRQGYHVEDNQLTTRDQADAFKAEHSVETTPQTFIEGKRVGGYDDLRDYFGLPPAETDNVSYQPVAAVFATTFLMAVATAWVTVGNLFSVRVIELYIAFSMCVLAILKLRDLYAFANQFITYDVLARRYVPYAYIYPFVEGLAGIFMVSQTLIWVIAPFALFISSVGVFSVIKAVYIEKRELKCACVGGNSNVPLGFISLTENLMMMAMAIWMMVK